MKSRISMLLAVLMFIGLLAGCGESGAGTPTPYQNAGQGQPRELHVAAVSAAAHVPRDEMYVWQKFYELTGIDIKWTMIPADSLNDQRNLMIAAGDLPDVFESCAFTASEVSIYTRDGIFVAMDDYLPKYAPNTVALYEKFPEIKQALVMADGKIYGWPRASEEGAVEHSLRLYYPWVVEYNGGVMPKTTQELMDWMMRVKAAIPSAYLYSQSVYTFSNESFASLRATLQGAWGLGNRGGILNDFSYYIDANPDDPSKIRFWAADPRFQEVLAYMNEMYVNDLIDPDSYSQEIAAWGAKLNAEIPMGMSTGNIHQWQDNGNRIGEEPSYRGLDTSLTGPYGDNLWPLVRKRVTRIANYVITSACKNVPLAVEAADFWMSDYAREMFIYGEEGVHFYWDEEYNTRRRSDWISKDPQGRTQNQMLGTFTNQPGGYWFGIQVKNSASDPIAAALTYSERADQYMKPYLPKIVWEQFNFTDEESRVIATIGTDIKAYCEELHTSFVNGNVSVKTYWDTYIKTLYDIGLQQLIDVHQSSYDRLIEAGMPIR